MAATEDSTIRTCEDLRYGDEIEAWHEGRLLHRGTVSQTLPTMGLFWILCSRTGTRKLVDMEASEIIRISAPTNPGPGRPEKTPAG